ncbi:UPF0716 protein YtzA [Pullulanibacillus camelliae]|uniref:UPF0716 protein YtzA n=1 Tax=Pullulanibacillus camelliae TaxID=1707096 RepID=A0A8J2YM31_9BACL|nr:FxsA family protein [Pullulanibacillus camelliae]GGE52011.1 UPF0716 protein YtzA [Pullulanibacillus camelliae]
MRNYLPFFILWIALEVMCFIFFWHFIGSFTVLLVIITSLLGAYLAQKQGRLIWARAREELSRGLMPGDAILEGAVVLFAGLFLLIPGFLSDLVGFILLVPAIRRKAKRLVYFGLKKLYNSGRFFFTFRR